jgi:hypothetical protein
VFKAYGNACACCGEPRLEFLTIDHVNNDGAQDRNRYGSRLVNRIKKLGFPPTYQILCYNCNGAKGVYGQCPHKLKVLGFKWETSTRAVPIGDKL